MYSRFSQKFGFFKKGPALPVSIVRILLCSTCYLTYFRLFMLDRIAGPFNLSTIGHIIATPIFYIACVFGVVGYFGRLSCFVLAIFVSIFQSLSPSHYPYYMSFMLFMISLTKCDSELSINIQNNSNKSRDYKISYWPVILICFQLSMMYFWSAFGKILSPAFISGDTLELIFLENYGRFFTDFSINNNLYTFFQLSGILTPILQIFLAYFIWIKRYQNLAIISGCILHLSMQIYLLKGPYSVLVFLTYYLAYHLVRIK